MAASPSTASSRRRSATHALVSPQISIQGQRWLLDWGTPEQRARYLGGIARGELIFSESISEPGVGSSMKLMQTRAEPDGDDWILNGRKTHVNLGHQSDVTLVYAVTDAGLTAFLVDTDLAGVTTAQTDPIGLRLIPTADVELVDVHVPSGAVLGEVGRGMDTFFSTFNISRLGNASELIGFGRRALTEALRYAERRQVGDHVVTSFQGIQWTVADCYAELYGASLARDRAAMLAERGEEHALETTLAKKLAIDASEHAVNEAFALVGGHGLYTDTDFGQLLHDMKVLRDRRWIAGGPAELRGTAGPGRGALRGLGVILGTNLTGLILDRAARRPEARFGVDRRAGDAGGRRRPRRGVPPPRSPQPASAPGTRVAVVGETSTSYLLTWMALVFAGAEPALINPTYPADLLDEMMADLEPAAVVWLHREPDAAVAGSVPHLDASDVAADRLVVVGGGPVRREQRGRPARARPPPARRRRIHAHLRHHRRPQVLHPDPRVLPPAGPLHRRLDVPLGRSTRCSLRSRCSTSTRSATAWWAASPAARMCSARRGSPPVVSGRS